MTNEQNSPAVAGPVERRVSQHFNGLTPAEAERLALLAEECGEVIQAIGKVLRHGYESRHPDGGPTNREALEKEIGDAHHAIIRMGNAGDISGNAVLRHADDKEKNVAKYLHHDG
jgi:NTP pyrophosphatase (non-canonical NTP hydrolase)